MHRRRGLFEAKATMSNKVRSLARGDRYTDTHALQAGSAEWSRDVSTALLCGPGPERVARLHSSVRPPPHSRGRGCLGPEPPRGNPSLHPLPGSSSPVSLLVPRFLPHSACGRKSGRGSGGQLPPFLIQLGPVLLRSLVECMGRTVMGALSTLQPHSVTPAIVVESTCQESHTQPRPWSRVGRWTPLRRASQTQRPTSCTPVLAADGRKRHPTELSPLSLLTSKCPSQPPPVGVPLLRPEGVQPRDSGSPSFVSSNPTCPPSRHMNCGCSVAAVFID